MITGDMEFDPLFAESDADDVDVVSLEQYSRQPVDRGVSDSLFTQYPHRSDSCYRRNATWTQESVRPQYYRLFPPTEETHSRMDCDGMFASNTIMILHIIHKLPDTTSAANMKQHIN